jgi:hypothetical protein
MSSIWHIIQHIAKQLTDKFSRASESGGHLQPRPITVGVRARNSNHSPHRPSHD